MLDDQSVTQDSYHHGNVKEALIDAALRLIESNQEGAMSLRRLSREVGITAPAVYNHFADKEALMIAIKVRIYGSFNKYFEERITGSDDPEKTLKEMCFAYYHFSRDFPSQFHFLFASAIPMDWTTPEHIEISGQCIVKTRKVVLDIYKKYQIPCDQHAVVNTTLLIWSQLHGIVTLRNSGMIQAAVTYQDWPDSCSLEHGEQVESLIENHIQIMVGGIINSAHKDHHH
ncbi:MAG: TetR/AcrR family transcriptional regulator [Gammaproteobacteria bacterium]|jgi:AcrR family transcriptional regulator|nr:TetR/AcrR family transcriptional regulator [Gammaproteobacteria bacterium]MBT3860106.1 TetR/AcrR family transcriptional regulator [Gammaproteobacteria bacterium]MBT3987398.1 TetR/AcrR family transcriptional regulator [Gammaproteobacteria bacterium]MBT4256541.1 TetR/AcrR family transcriptional regulator [Gammaproteobacteria bacterium]MBT4581864.1 TetR/AcrR family transcriptional regulator [Gammaproteobacteria bacterium]